jgi:2-polyprenyl-3-methyl-5-hydroxy-6-metoxy-1,4-benzoquinol methylase
MTHAHLEHTGERLIPDLEQEDWNVDVHRSRYAYAATFVKPDGSILDFGCGTGYGLQQLASRTKSLCVGVDKLEAVAYAQERYPAPNIQYVAADITKPGARFGKFDMIVSFDVIEHLDDIDTYVANISAQLRDDDSIAIISTPWSLRRNNLYPLHNPHHTCEMSSLEFVSRLQRHLEVEELTLTMGMLARLRRKEAPVKPFGSQVITISASALGEVEDHIESYGQRCEQADLLRHDLTLLSRHASSQGRQRKALQRADLALRTVVAPDRKKHQRLQMDHAQTYTASMLGEANGLTGIDLILTTHNRLLGGDICIALYDGDVCVAQASKPAILLSDIAACRFIFPVLPDSKDGKYRLQVTYESAIERNGPAIWCTSQGEPCVRTLYRRYEWPGPPYLMPAPRLLSGASNLPLLPGLTDLPLDGTILPHVEEPQASLSRLKKLQRAYVEEGPAGIGRTVREYIQWRLQHV